MTLGVGLIVSFGALYVDRLGGAFQVNQYLSGIFSIPMIIPVIMGVLFWRPQPWGAIACMVVGITVGSVLNANKSIDWQTATFIEVVVCVAVFLASGFFLSKNTGYNTRVTAFFKKLATPAPPSDEPGHDIVSGLMVLYALAFIVTGSLFIITSIPSLGSQSGNLAMGCGVACVITAAVFYSKRKRKLQTS